MSLRSKLNRLERRTGKAVDDCPACRKWCVVVNHKRELTPEHFTCPRCGQKRTSLVIIMDLFDDVIDTPSPRGA